MQKGYVSTIKGMPIPEAIFVDLNSEEFFTVTVFWLLYGFVAKNEKPARRLSIVNNLQIIRKNGPASAGEPKNR